MIQSHSFYLDQLTMEAVNVVHETLRRACSQDSTQLKPAEQQLAEWEKQLGFYSTLMVCKRV